MQQTGMHLAAKRGNLDIIELLLGHKGQVDAEDAVSPLLGWRGGRFDPVVWISAAAEPDANPPFHPFAESICGWSLARSGNNQMPFLGVTTADRQNSHFLCSQGRLLRDRHSPAEEIGLSLVHAQQRFQEIYAAAEPAGQVSAPQIEAGNARPHYAPALSRSRQLLGIRTRSQTFAPVLRHLRLFSGILRYPVAAQPSRDQTGGLSPRSGFVF